MPGSFQVNAPGGVPNTMGIPAVRSFGELPTIYERVTQLKGVSRDSLGVALAGCTCTLFRVVGGDFVQEQQVVSDASGNYQFNVSPTDTYRVTWDLAGSPTRAGISLKSLTGTAA